MSTSRGAHTQGWWGGPARRAGLEGSGAGSSELEQALLTSRTCAGGGGVLLQGISEKPMKSPTKSTLLPPPSH